MDELIELERRTWDALSSSEPGRAERFLGELLRGDARMLFPGGLLLAGRRQILDSLAAQPWAHFEIREPHAIALGANAGIVTYRVSARRDNAPDYSALVSSTYLRVDGAWRLVVHQHTPE